MEAKWLVIGNLAVAEFDRASVLFDTMPAVEYCASLDIARQRLATVDWRPNWLVLVERRPGELNRQAVAQLRAVAPLAKVIVLLGAWCAGETRSGEPITGAIRIPAADWPRLWQRWISLPETERARHAWSLPATASEGERIAAEMLSPPTFTAGQTVAVAVHDVELGPLIVQVLGAAGWTVQRADATHLVDQPPPALVWQDDGTDAQRSATALAGYRERWPAARIVVLRSFTRHHERRLLEAAGVDAVIDQPFVIHDLCWALGSN